MFLAVDPKVSIILRIDLVPNLYPSSRNYLHFLETIVALGVHLGKCCTGNK